MTTSSVDLILATPSVAFVQHARGALDGLGLSMAHVWSRSVDPARLSAGGGLADLLPAIAEAEPLVVALGPGIPDAAALDLARSLEQGRPDAVVVLIAAPSAELWREAARAGVRDVLDPNSPVEELRQAVQRDLGAARERRDRLVAGSDQGHGRLVTVLSPKGGSGKTMLSTSLATALAMSGAGSVALVDLDLQFGDIPAALHLSPEHSILDVARAGRIDATAVKVFMTPHPSGIFVLTAPRTPAEGETITLDVVDRVLDLLVRSFDHVVVDTGAGVDEFALRAVERSTDLVALCSLDVASATSLKKELDVLDRLGLDTAVRHLVVNRVDRGVGLTTEDVEALIGLGQAVRIPLTRRVPLAMNLGRTIVEEAARSDEARAIALLAGRIARAGGRTVAEAPATSGPWPWRRSQRSG